MRGVDCRPRSWREACAVVQIVVVMSVEMCVDGLDIGIGYRDKGRGGFKCD